MKFAICGMILFFAIGANAAEMDIALQARLNAMPAGGTIQTLAYFTNQADISNLDRELKIEHATLADRNRRVILALQEAATQSQPEMVSFLESLKAQGTIKDYKMFWIANMFWVEGSKEGLEAISGRQELNKLYLNYEIEGIQPVKSEPASNILTGHETGLSLINAPAAWAHGWTGAGRVVMNIDTGVDGTHPALSARFRGDVNGDGNVNESWFDPYITHSPTPIDGGRHGTHTMGTICGRTADGDTIGVAVDAEWIAAGAIDRGGSISRSIADAIASFQWAVDPDSDPDTQDNPDVISNSWGVTLVHGYPPCDQTLWMVIDNCEMAGSAVVFAAGNEGSGESTIRRPADRGMTPYSCFSVGAIDGRNDSLKIVGFSSRGPSYCSPDGELVIKPEVVAPGIQVRSSIPGGGYLNMDGTSMATPHVAGAIALIRQANPNLDVDAIKEILIETAHETLADSAPGEDNSYGNGIIDVYEACLVAQSYSLLDGNIRDINAIPIRGARINIVGTARGVLSDRDGRYAIGLRGDSTYTLEVSRFGYISVDTQVTIPANDTITVDFVMPPVPPGSLHGAVRDRANLSPVVGAIVEAVGTPIEPVITNDSGQYLFSAIPGGMTYTIGVHGGAHEPASDTVFVSGGGSAELNFSVLALESFENDNGGWRGAGCWEWGRPTSGPDTAYDGVNVWATSLTGDYPNNASDSLFSSYITVEDPNATLSFYHWYNFETGYDGGNVAVSYNAGTSWTIITPEGGYSNSSVIGLGRQPGFTGLSEGWQQTTFDLDRYRGMAILIRPRIGTDGAFTRSGWYIDAVSLHGATAREEGSPQIVVTPRSFGITVQQGDSTTLPLMISNSGTGVLAFGLRAVATSRFLDRRGDIPIKNRLIRRESGSDLGIMKSASEDIMPGPPMLLASGGPDDFGYRWLDSAEPDGPLFSWVDVSEFGQELVMDDDDNQGPFDLGFSMPFYDSTYTSIRICSNGFISFTSGFDTYDNTSIPNVNDPNNLVAPYWDDLNPLLGGRIFFYTNYRDSAVVAWDSIAHFGNNGRYIFEIILSSDGNIVYQYRSMVGNLNQSTIGIENSTGEIGLQVAFNQDYAADSLAIKFLYPSFWLRVAPFAGYDLAGGSSQIAVTFNSSGLTQGTYLGLINISSNDPDEPFIILPCTLNVGPVSVSEETSNLPTTPSLSQNYPNPFNPTTQIKFALPHAGQVTLSVFDLLGREVKRLVDGSLGAGYHTVIWDGRDANGQSVTSGIYFYTIKAGDFSQSRKMVLLK